MGLGHSISFDSLILAESSPSNLLDVVAGASRWRVILFGKKEKSL
jgi:hypothetical protein